MANKKKRKYEEEENYVPKAFKKKGKIEKEEKNSKKEQKRKKQGKKAKKHSKLKRAILILILVAILILGICLGVSAHTWKTLAQDMLINENSIVKDTEGNIIAQLGSEKKKQYISYKEMPQDLKNAYVAIEDERFYSHHGVDIKRTGSAIVSYVIHFGSSSYGGSTITQQLVKNLTGDSTDSITRKVKEWWKAWLLETCLEKDEILEAYLNAIYVGPNIYGVETGAKYYFNKSAKDLSLAECAFLAGINNSPNSYNPFTDDDNNVKIKKRTNTVLMKMKELGYINEESYSTAIASVDNRIKL